MLNKIMNELICRTMHVRKLCNKLRKSRLRWFDDVQKKQEDYVGRKVLQMGLPGKELEADQGVN